MYLKPDTEKRSGGSVLVWRNGAVLCVWGSPILMRRFCAEIERRFARIVVNVRLRLPLRLRLAVQRYPTVSTARHS